MKAERSRHVVLVTPPAVERADGVWNLIGSTPNTVVICGDHEQAVAWADTAPAALRAHAVTGLARSAALLKDGRVGLLSGAVADLAALVAQAMLKLDTIETIVIAWPESFAADLDTLLAEAPDARRIILSWNPPALTDFIERHARRAEIVGKLALDVEGRPLGPVTAARFTVATPARRKAAVREALDALRATRPYVWSGGPIAASPTEADAVVAALLPTRDELHALAAIGRAPVIVVSASQLPYLKSIATLTPLTLPSSVDRAQDRTAGLRALIEDRLERGDVDAELAVLAPLFEEHEPALVAGALLALSRQPSVDSRQPPVPANTAGWTKIFVTVGTKDRASAKDLVGALIKEAGLTKGQIGRIDVKETFSLVEIAGPAADQAVQRLSGVSIRGRRVTARQDRG